MPDNGNLVLNCRLHLNKPKALILDEMLQLQTIVYYEELETVFMAKRKQDAVSILLLSLQPEIIDPIPEHSRTFPVIVPEDEAATELFKEVFTAQLEMEWHQLRNHLLENHHTEPQLILRIHCEHQLLYGAIRLLQREFESTFKSSGTS